MLTFVTNLGKTDIFKFIYTLYIHREIKTNKREVESMAVANLKKIDEKLNNLYKDQITTNISKDAFVDRSDILLAQMNFIAVANKQALHIK